MNLCQVFTPAGIRERLVRRVVRLGIAMSVGGIGATCCGQSYYPAPEPAPVANEPLSSAQLDQLTASIALYPDPLLAQLLPAATYPLDVVSANQWLRSNPAPTEDAIDAQPWDPSIKAMAHYPSVLSMMADNIDWIQQLGEAYLNQPGDVMNSIQRLRAEALAAGTLVSTAQQQVLNQDGEISILPAEPDSIYVPEYDPSVVYIRHAEPRRDLIRFGPGLHIGLWLDKDTDWHDHWIANDVHWDREHRSGPPQVIVQRRNEEAAHQWHRDGNKPIVVHMNRPDTDNHRGYAPPHAQPVEPQHGFGGYQDRQQTVREEDRGRQSLHQPAPHVEEHRAAPAPAHSAPAPEHHEAPRPPERGPDHGDDHGGHH